MKEYVCALQQTLLNQMGTESVLALEASKGPVPEDESTSCNPVCLNTHISKVAVKTRKANGEVLSTSDNISAALWTIAAYVGNNSRLS